MTDPRPFGKNDTAPITLAEVLACEHPNLRSAYAVDGPL